MTRLFTALALALFLAAPAFAQSTPEASGDAVAASTPSISEEALERHVGSYSLQPGVLLHVTREGDTLFAGAGEYDPHQMTASTETDFFVLAIGAQITFNLAEDGSTKSLTLNQSGMSIEAPRAE